MDDEKMPTLPPKTSVLNRFRTRSKRDRANRRLNTTKPNARRRLLRAELLEDRRLLAADVLLVADVNLEPGQGSNPQEIVAIGDGLYFSADDGIVGSEIWRFDTLTKQTEIALDLPSDSSGSSPSSLFTFAGDLYFSAHESSEQRFLKLHHFSIQDDVGEVIRDATTPPYGASSILAVGDTLYFLGSTDFATPQIWSYKPATDELTLLTNVGLDAQGLIESGGDLYFSARDSESDIELWKYDIALNQLTQVADIMSGTGGTISEVTAFNDKLYFSADDGISGSELWAYNPNASGGSGTATQVADIYPGAISGAPGDFVVLGNLLYFTANNGLPGTVGGTLGRDIWRFDPSGNGGSGEVSLVSETGANDSSDSPSRLTTVNDKLVYISRSSAAGFEFWEYNPAGNGGRGSGSLVKAVSGPRYPSELTATDSGIYFNAEDPQSGRELFVLTLNTPPVAANDSFEAIKNTPAILDVLANNGSGVDTDADQDVLTIDSVTQPTHGIVSITADGTLRYEPAQDYSGVDQFTYTISDGFGGTDTATVNLDVIVRPELVINDVTLDEGDSGTTRLIFQVDIIGEPTQPVSVAFQTLDGTATVANDDYAATSGTLDWGPGETDTRFITVSVSGDALFENTEYLSLVLTNPTNAVLTADRAYGYLVNDDDAFATTSYHAVEYSVVEILPADATFDPNTKTDSVEFDGRLYFVAQTGESDQLWAINPLTQRYEVVPDISPSRPYSRYTKRHLAATDTHLFFSRIDDATEESVIYSWRGPGNTPLRLASGTGLSSSGTTASDSRFFFSLKDEAGVEPWSSDGTVEGTFRFVDAVPGPQNSFAQTEIVWNLTESGFSFFNSEVNEEKRVIITDGTRENTTTILTGVRGSNFTEHKGRVYFITSDAYTSQLWSTDGTKSGTRQEFVFDTPTHYVLATGLTSLKDQLIVRLNMQHKTDPGESISSQLWAYQDGVTTQIKSYDSSQEFFSVVASTEHKALIAEFYSAFGYTFLKGLWLTDGTDSMPVSIPDFQPDAFWTSRGYHASRDQFFFSIVDPYLRGVTYSISETDASVIELFQNDNVQIGLQRYVTAADPNGRVYAEHSNPTNNGHGIYAITSRPIAKLPETTIAKEGSLLKIDTTQSIVFDSDVATFEWDYDYVSGAFDADAFGKVFQRTLPDGPCEIDIALRVVDIWGHESIAVTRVIVENAAPLVFDLPDGSTTIGSAMTFAPTIVDPSNVDTLNFQWDLGNGVTLTDVDTVTAFYDANGEYFASLTVTDSDGAVTVTNFRVVVGPPVTVAASATDMEEGQGVALTASLVTALSTDVVVPITYSGTAINGIDFAATTLGGAAPSQILIPAGATSGSIQIFNLQDALDEDIEPLVIEMGIPSNASLVSHTPIRIDLLDDDAEPTVFISSTPQVITEADFVLPLTISLSEVSGKDVIVSLATGGTALLDSDYQLGDEILVIPAGEASVSTALAIIDDNLGEGAEQVSVSIALAQDAVVSSLSSAPDKITHVISANDTPSIQFASVLKSVAEEAGPHVVTVTLSNPVDSVVSASVSWTGDAVPGQDFDATAFPQTLVFGVGETIKTISVGILDDDGLDGQKDLILTISGAIGATLGATPTHLTRILDNEDLSVSLSTTKSTVWEDSNGFQLVARLSRIHPSDVFVPFNVATTSEMVNGKDYLLDLTPIRILAGTSVGIRTVKLDADDESQSISQSSKSLRFDFESPANAFIQGPSSQRVTILDNDSKVEFVETSVQALEGLERIVEIKLDRPTNRTITVPITYKAVTTSLGDFSGPTSVTLDGQSTKFSVTIHGDDIFEATESFQIKLGTPQNAALGANDKLTVKIVDLDSPPTARLVFPAATLREGDIFRPQIRLSRSAETTVRVDAYFSGEATIGSLYDYTVGGAVETSNRVRRRFVFQPGETTKTLDIHLLRDDEQEGTEYFTIDLIGQANSLIQDSLRVPLNDSRYRVRFVSVIEYYQTRYEEIQNEVASYNQDNENNVSHGYVAESLVFFDANFNQVHDFVDTNQNGVRDPNELVEPFWTTEYDGFTIATLPQDFDQNRNGIVDPTEGQLVARGGIDVSIGRALSVPLVAPFGYPTTSPLSTLVMARVRDTGRTLAEAEQDVASAFEILSSNYVRGDLILLANENDPIASDAFTKSTQLYSTVAQVAHFVSGFASIDVAVAGQLAFRDVAAKLDELDALLDFAEPVVVQSIVLGTLSRAGIFVADDDLITAVTQLIVAGNQQFQSVGGKDGRGFIEEVARVQRITEVDLADRLYELAVGSASISESLNDFTGNALLDRIAGATVGNVVAPKVFATDGRMIEGDAGEYLLEFEVMLTDASNLPVTVEFSTSGLTATADEDFTSVKGQLSWDPGETSVQRIQVPILSDSDFEPDETLRLIFDNAVNSAVLTPIAIGTIVNDDLPILALPGTTDPKHILVAEDFGVRVMNGFDVLLDGPISGSEPFTVVSGSGVETNLIATIKSLAAIPADGIRFLGNGVNSSLTIDASFATSVDHVQYSDGKGRFVIDGATLRYENVESIVSPASAVLTGIPVNDIRYGETLSLIGMPSSLFDATQIIDESWTVYRDDQVIATESGNELQVTADEVGVYRLTYKATQDGRLPAIASYEYEVIAVPPSATIVSADTGDEGAEFQFDADASDPDGADEELTYVWTFGDGVAVGDSTVIDDARFDGPVTVGYSLESDRDIAQSFTVQDEGTLESIDLQFQFDPGTTGSVLVQIVAVDESGFPDLSQVLGSKSIDITQLNRNVWSSIDGFSVAVQKFDVLAILVRKEQPSTSIGIRGAYGNVYSAGQGFSKHDLDPDWVAISSDVVFRTFVTSPPSVELYGKEVSHTYADNGDYEVTLTVTDKDGLSTIVAKTIRIENVAPTAVISDISTVRIEGTPIDVVASATDPAGINDTLAFAYQVFKDGDLFASGGGIGENTFGFTPDDDGSYEIKLTVSDEDGGQSGATQHLSLATAELGTTGGPVSGVSLNGVQLVGAKFEVTADMDVTAIGGHILTHSGTGPFAALVRLSGPNDFPDSFDLSTPDVIAATVLQNSIGASADISSAIDATLTPGWYAVVMGSELFGASGNSVAATNNSTIGSPVFFSKQNAQPYLNDTSITDIRFYIAGTAAGGGSRQTIVVENANPTAFPDSASVSENDPETIVDIISNDTDPAGVNDPLKVLAIDTTVTAGRVRIESDNVLYFTNQKFDHLAVGESAIDTFVYRVEDGDGGSDSATVTITVNGQNDLPIAEDVEASFGEDLTELLIVARYSDVDTSDTHLISLDGSLLAGSVTDNKDGTFSYRSNGVFEYLGEGETAIEYFSYTVDDGNGGTSSATVSITIQGVNDAPVLANPVADIVVDQGDPDMTIDLSSTFFDVDSEFTIGAISGDQSLVTVSLIGTELTLAFPPSQSGHTQITVTANDGGGGIVSMSFDVTVINDEPGFITANSSASALEDASESGVVDFYGTFVDRGTDIHAVTVDWGDGTGVEDVTVDQTNDAFAGHHSYQYGGIFTILVTLTDSNGAVTQTSTRAVVQGVGTIDRTLYIIGSEYDDDVKIEVDSRSGEVEVKAKLGHGRGARKIEKVYDADDVDSVVAYLFDGDDRYEIKQKKNSHSNPEVAIPQLVFGGDGEDRIEADRDYAGVLEIHGQAGDDRIDGGGADDLLYGGEGDDRINGGPGDDVIFGGEGNDRLEGGHEGRWEEGSDIIIGGNGDDRIAGGRGSDLLIGGGGADDIRGNKGGDLLIGGFTAFDQSLDDLLRLRAEWTSVQSYQERVNNMREGEGPVLENTTIRLRGSGDDATVFDDDETDRLQGGSGNDWYFAQLADEEDDDRISKSRFEILDLLDS